MRPRIAQELELLKKYYEGVEHQEVGTNDWFLIPAYPVPKGWRIGSEEVSSMKVAFAVSAGHPGAPPYGFLVSHGINYNRATPISSIPSIALTIYKAGGKQQRQGMILPS